MHKKYRLKHLFEKRIGGAWGNEPDKNDEGIACLRAADINTDQFSHKADDLTYRIFSDQELKTRKLRLGDIIIEKSGGGENQPVGRVALFTLREDALCSNFLDLLRPDNKIVNSKFLVYILYYLWESRVVNLSIKQTTGIQNLDIEDYLNNEVFIPSLNQQNKIVDYLDKEVSKIDALIEKKTQLLNLLEEKKKATISQAVTKGLDLSVPMKDSGIEWLGEIPKHWEKNKISRVFNLIGSGTTPNSSNISYYVDGDLSWLNTGDLNDDILYSTSKYITQLAVDEHSTLKLFPKDSLVIAMYGATIGKTALTKIECYTNQACCVLNNSKLVNTRFAQFYFIAIKEFLVNLSNGGGQPNISQGIIKDIMIIFPTIDEQQKIILFIESKLREFDDLHSKINQSIDLLKEKRTAIISAAINGEINLD